VGLWYRIRGGYGYAWIRDANTAETLRARRAAERKKWESKMARRRAAEGLPKLPTPQGSYRGELPPETAPVKKRSRDVRNEPDAS